MKHIVGTCFLLGMLLAACGSVDLDAPIPVYDTKVDPNEWVVVPAGKFLSGQFNDPVMIDYDYEIMVTDVTVTQYIDFLNTSLVDGPIEIMDEQIVIFYPGDEFHGARHEVEIAAGEYIVVPLDDPASRFAFEGDTFQVKDGYENHPMTNVSWFGARAYCRINHWRLPTEMEWEKAARGIDGRPYPWGDRIVRNNANVYASQDPFEDMGSFGSRTSPVGFYSGQTYDGYTTLDSASPYGLYDMAGNVWQWTGDIYEGMHYRFLRGGSKDTYGMDLRVWVRNNATPEYFSPGVGFRCVREP